jgi:hypothetical protein
VGFDRPVRSASSVLLSEVSPGLNARSTAKPRTTLCTSRASSEAVSNLSVLAFRSTAVSLPMEPFRVDELEI